jgi:hypothetical protein
MFCIYNFILDKIVLHYGYKYQRNYTIKIRIKFIEQLNSVGRDGDAF